LSRPPTVADLSHLSAVARRSAQAKDWVTVGACAREILRRDRKAPEGWFLSGLVEKADGRRQAAVAAFSKAIKFDQGRYDAAIELAFQQWNLFRHGQACDLLQRYESRLSNSPLYLEMAADLYSRLGLHARAWPLYQKANELQPDIDRFQASLAACGVLLGRIEEAKSIYLGLLRRHAGHQRNHYELSRLERASDSAHVEQMKKVLETSGLPGDKNIFLYYAIAKELEDLEQWEEAFDYYQLGGNSAAGVARGQGYDVSNDIGLIDRIIEICNSDWMGAGAARTRAEQEHKTPILIVGLPRTGTTLVELIVAGHSQVESADETFFLRIVIKHLSGIDSSEEMNARMVEAAAKKDASLIAKNYLGAVDYRLGQSPMFIDKFPFNFLYLGFIAKAFPDARIIHLRRSPMDACFAMYKQSFFAFAYSLEDLARYYVAYDRLNRHWREHLGERIIEVEYESLVADPDAQTRLLLDRLGLQFEQACLDFHLNQTPSATASTVQVREKAHTRSVCRWKKFERQLQPLKDHLEAAGIEVG
jgi:tetratricopeptide (TPR) repeat protein